MATILPPTDASVHQAARFLVSGGLVALPTETVYGLAADATNPDAVAKIYEAKNRPATNPLIVHIDGPERVSEFTEPPDDTWECLAEIFWPGPLTLILPRRGAKISDLVTAGLPTVGLRVPDVDITRRVIAEVGKPLAAPSANPANYVSPTSAQHVQDSLGGRIELILDGGPCRRGIESTILDISEKGRARLLRPGPIAPEALEEALQRHVQPVFEKNSERAAQMAPGQLRAHYQPRARVYLWHDAIPQLEGAKKAAAVTFQKPTLATSAHHYWLTESGAAEEAARNLYGLMRQLDADGYEVLYIEKAPRSPLGDSINERLERASAKD